LARGVDYISIDGKGFFHSMARIDQVAKVQEGETIYLVLLPGGAFAFLSAIPEEDLVRRIGVRGFGLSRLVEGRLEVLVPPPAEDSGR
jgi:hypothetical protein